MRSAEIITTTKTKTPDQLRVDSLKANAERATKAMSAEKARQKPLKAQEGQRKRRL